MAAIHTRQDTPREAESEYVDGLGRLSRPLDENINYIFKDNHILNAQVRLLNNEISVGNFLDKLR